MNFSLCRQALMDPEFRKNRGTVQSSIRGERGSTIHNCSLGRRTGSDTHETPCHENSIHITTCKNVFFLPLFRLF